MRAQATCDITKDGRTDVLVGRDDGTIEVWSCDVGDEPALIYTKCINESITSVSSGIVTQPGFDDVAVVAFSGKIISFSSYAVGDELPPEALEDDEPADKKEKKEKEKKKKAGTVEDEGAATAKRTDKQIEKLNKELDELRKKVCAARTHHAIDPSRVTLSLRQAH